MDSKLLEFCKNCNNRSFDLKKGFLCKLTDEKPNFKDFCPDFIQDTTLLQKEEEKRRVSRTPQSTSFIEENLVLKNESSPYSSLSYFPYLLLIYGVLFLVTCFTISMLSDDFDDRSLYLSQYSWIMYVIDFLGVIWVFFVGKQLQKPKPFIFIILFSLLVSIYWFIASKYQLLTIETSFIYNTGFTVISTIGYFLLSLWVGKTLFAKTKQSIVFAVVFTFVILVSEPFIHSSNFFMKLIFRDLGDSYELYFSLFVMKFLLPIVRWVTTLCIIGKLKTTNWFTDWDIDISIPKLPKGLYIILLLLIFTFIFLYSTALFPPYERFDFPGFTITYYKLCFANILFWFILIWVYRKLLLEYFVQHAKPLSWNYYFANTPIIGIFFWIYNVIQDQPKNQSEIISSVKKFSYSLGILYLLVLVSLLQFMVVVMGRNVGTEQVFYLIGSVVGLVLYLTLKEFIHIQMLFALLIFVLFAYFQISGYELGVNLRVLNYLFSMFFVGLCGYYVIHPVFYFNHYKVTVYDGVENNDEIDEIGKMEV